MAQNNAQLLALSVKKTQVSVWSIPFIEYQYEQFHFVFTCTTDFIFKSESVLGKFYQKISRNKL